MARCPSCEYPLPRDRERVGSRCPNCHDPLYEPRSTSRPIRAGEAACVVHPHNESSGPCQRCGAFLCEVCRCRWMEQTVCSTCVDNALANNEALASDDRARFRQALRGLGLSVTAWTLGAVGYFWFVRGGLSSGTIHPMLALTILVGFASAITVSLFAVGQSSAALRLGGRHTPLAGAGLILGSLFLGAPIGVVALGLWVV